MNKRLRLGQAQNLVYDSCWNLITVRFEFLPLSIAVHPGLLDKRVNIGYGSSHASPHAGSHIPKSLLSNGNSLDAGRCMCLYTAAQHQVSVRYKGRALGALRSKVPACPDNTIVRGALEHARVQNRTQLSSTTGVLATCLCADERCVCLFWRIG